MSRNHFQRQQMKPFEKKKINKPTRPRPLGDNSMDDASNSREANSADNKTAKQNDKGG